MTPGTDDDWYQMEVNSGDFLNVDFLIPASGSGEFVNNLDVGVELYAPSDLTSPVASATGASMNLSHSAGETGTYLMRVFSEAGTRGEYVVQVGGNSGANPAPFVIDPDPDDGAVVGTFPLTYTLDFSETVLDSTVDSDDLFVNGLPATDVVAIDGDTYEFMLDPDANTGDGVYNVSLVGESLQDLQGVGNDPFFATFILDQTGPRIVQTTWNGGTYPTGGLFSEGALDVELSFDEALLLNRSAAKGLRAPSSDDIQIEDIDTGAIFNPDFVSSTDDTFTASFFFLPEGNYELTAFSGDNALRTSLATTWTAIRLGPAKTVPSRVTVCPAGTTAFH